MGHYAILNKDNKVIKVITGRDEGELGIDWESYYGEKMEAVAKRTSYNTFHNKHLSGKAPFRGNFAGIDFTYDPLLDAFIPPKPFESWILDNSILDWVSPVAYPTDGARYFWNEEKKSWDLSEEV